MSDLACMAARAADDKLALDTVVIDALDPIETCRLLEERSRLMLVLAGPVGDDVPSGRNVTVLGPVPEEHKFGLIAAADVLVNPSFYESFSIVILEAWLAGTPVLVNGWCGPLVEHCEASGGGLWWTGLADFEIALGRLPVLLEDAGNGRFSAADRPHHGHQAATAPVEGNPLLIGPEAFDR